MQFHLRGQPRPHVVRFCWWPLQVGRGDLRERHPGWALGLRRPSEAITKKKNRQGAEGLLDSTVELLHDMQARSRGRSCRQRPFIASNVTGKSKLQHDGVPYHQCLICQGSSIGSWWLGHQEWGTYAAQVLVKI